MDWLIGGTDPIRREIEVGYDSLYKPNIDTYSRYSTSSYNSNNRRSLNRLSSIDENYSLGLNGLKASTTYGSSDPMMFRSAFNDLNSTALLNTTSYLNNSSLTTKNNDSSLNYLGNTSGLKWENDEPSTRDYLESPTTLFLTNPIFNANVKPKNQASVSRSFSNSNSFNANSNKDQAVFQSGVQASIASIKSDNKDNFGFYLENNFDGFQIPSKISGEIYF
jgi:hypothetical protein